MTSDSWIIEFDSRSDGGPRLVGPFPSKEEAHAWLADQSGYDFEANAAPLAHGGPGAFLSFPEGTTMHNAGMLMYRLLAAWEMVTHAQRTKKGLHFGATIPDEEPAPIVGGDDTVTGGTES